MARQEYNVMTVQRIIPQEDGERIVVTSESYGAHVAYQYQDNNDDWRTWHDEGAGFRWGELDAIIEALTAIRDAHASQR